MKMSNRIEIEKLEMLVGKIFPLVFIAMMFLMAFVNFVTKYGIAGNAENRSRNSEMIFYVDFYVFVFLAFFSIVMLIFFKGFYFKIAMTILGITAICFVNYNANDLFTIKIFIFIAWTFAAIISFEWKFNFALAFVSQICFFACQYHPDFLGTLSIAQEDLHPSAQDAFALFSFFVAATFVSAIIRFYGEHWNESERRAQHINLVMTQMTLLNRQLQEYAKTRGKKSAEQERLRITRDLHDSCGYTFVNITSMMDAAMSNPKMSGEEVNEIFLTIRNLASQGLAQTRKTLHEIRDLQENPESNLMAISDIKNIFKHITGINVEVNTGNIKNDYGRALNSIIVKMLQESLANAIRHGNAKNIYISFWEENKILTMNVKDDGIGAVKIVKGIGLSGMEERLAQQGGDLEITLPKEGGFRITARVPIKEWQEI